MKTFVCSFLCLILTYVILLNQSSSAPKSGRDRYVSSALVDTPKFSIPFSCSMNGRWSFGVNFGIHPNATNGIDPVLGEEEYPPFPPGGGMTMLRTTGGNAILDLRPYIDPNQVNTYTIGIALDETDTTLFPITFSWPDLASYYSGPVRLKSDLSGSLFDIDMKAQTSFTRTAYPGIPAMQVWTVYIVAQGPLPGNHPPVVSTYGLSPYGLTAIVNAPTGALSAGTNGVQHTAGATSVWFEYGPTLAYGTSTVPQSVAEGTSTNLGEPFSLSSIPLNTRIHFRAVASNGLGTFYGGDRIMSNGTPPPEDSSGYVRYRTATYRDWADAKDQKNKRKAFKTAPDKYFFRFYMVNSSPNIDGIDIKLDDKNILWDTSVHTQPAFNAAGMGKFFKGKMCVRFIFAPPLQPGDTAFVSGYTLKPKAMKVKQYYWWQGSAPPVTMVGSMQTVVGFPNNDPKLPMPNLINVGEDLFGGMAQTPYGITVGTTDDPRGAHTVYHPKYKDVLKSLVKGGKGGDLYHTAPPRCLDVFDKNKQEILKRQKSLPPDKHNNILFAEQLTLKLNVAASDSGLFPEGLGNLIYSNSTPFDGRSVRDIMAKTDTFLGCTTDPPLGVEDSSIYLKILQDINSAFAGPMDTVSWGGDNVICTGVKMLMNVPYLHAPASGTPRTVFVRRHMTPGLNQPSRFELHQNYPNPFNPTTTISFTLTEDALVSLKIFNTLGQEVATAIDRQEYSEGTNEVEFDGSPLPTGVYFYQLIARDMQGASILHSGTGKMLLVK